MSETVSCPSCGRTLRVPESLLGQQVKCPACQGAFLASADAPPPRESVAPRPRREEDDEPRRPRRDEGDEPRRGRRASFREEEDDEDRPPSRRRTAGMAPHRGVLILIFGLLGFFVCVIFGVMAWVMGNADLKEIRAGRMDPEGEGLTNAGRIIGMIVTILNVVSICLVVPLIILFAAMAKR